MRTSFRFFSLAAATAAVTAVAVLPGCDPCAGISVCGDARVDVEGRLRVLLTGAPADSVRVIVEPITEGAFEPTGTWTDSAGWFRVVLPASGGTVQPARLVFVPPEWPHLAYGVEVDLPITRLDGARRYIGEWAVGPYAADPHIRARGRLRHEHAGGSPSGVEITFEPTSGPAITPEVVTTHSNAAGEFLFYAEAAKPGTVVGRLILSLPPPFARQVIEEVEIPVFTAAPLVEEIGEWTVDYTLRYAGELRWGNGTAVEGAEVTFRRTDGVVAEPDPHTMTSGGDGRFWFELVALDLGIVGGELTVLPPGGTEEVALGTVELETFVGEPRFLGVWWIDHVEENSDDH